MALASCELRCFRSTTSAGSAFPLNPLLRDLGVITFLLAVVSPYRFVSVRILSREIQQSCSRRSSAKYI
jgi:hypothetical protein